MHSLNLFSENSLYLLRGKPSSFVFSPFSKKVLFNPLDFLAILRKISLICLYPKIFVPLRCAERISRPPLIKRH